MRKEERYNRANDWERRELTNEERQQARLALEDKVQHLVTTCGLAFSSTKVAYRAYLKVGGYLKLTAFLPPEDEDEDEDEEVTEADRFNELQEVRSEQS